MRTGTIYTLADPRTGLVRYVGQTVRDIRRRYSGHIYQWKRCKGRTTHINSWIKNLAKEGLLPVIDIIEEGIPIDALDSKEVSYIQLFKAVGALLCNHTVGGGGTRGFKWDKERLEKRSETFKNSEAWARKCKEHSSKLKGRTFKNKSDVPTMLTNLETGEEHMFPSKAQAARFLGVPYREFAKKADSKSGKYLGFRINKNPKGSK